MYKFSVAEIASELRTSVESGLSSEEAKRRVAANGYNEFAKRKQKSLIVKFLEQFKSFMIIVLIVAAIVSGAVGIHNGEGFTDAIIILAIVVINAIIGVAQEAKAEKSLEALERMSAPHAKVVRDGNVVVIEARELVVGDVVEIETGDSVPADLRLTEAVNLKIGEAALTGESLPVEKTTEAINHTVEIGDRENMAFSSCSVTYGRGRGIVVATGERTEVGKIATMIDSVGNRKTPMQERLDKLGKFLAIAALVICAIIFVVGIAYGNDIVTMFMTAVSLAAAAIPEGLPAVSTIVLAIGVQRLAKQNAIIRNLPSVETLGSTTVICSDKTGTLTQNRMTVTHIYTEGALSTSDCLSDTAQLLTRIAVLANDAKFSRTAEGATSIGDPTETSLVDLGAKHSLFKDELEAEAERVAEIPFDSERKLMTTIHRTEAGLMVATKGAMDELLQVCNRIVDGGKERDITAEDIERLKRENEAMANQALRVLAMAYKDIDAVPEEVTPASVERDLVFVGMVGMIDPPREEVKASVAECRKAGIRPVMITGDHRITAMAIARALGIMLDGDRALTGTEVEAMTDDELYEAAATVAVFARVAPEHKVRIVKAFQRRGNIVAMTGDGVNDAPALKLADIGVAMGITGTDVSKEASDVILADDNFATIVSAVKEGRRIYDNLLKSIQFMLSTNLGEIMVLFTAVIANWATPLLPIHILWINLVTDSLPALALSVDPASHDIMSRKPLDPKQGILTRSLSLRIVLQGVMITALVLWAYNIGMERGVDVARTMTFATLAFSQMTLIFSIRSGMENAFSTLFSNLLLWGAILFVVLLMGVVLFVPALQSIFHIVDLSTAEWLWVVGLSFAPFVLSEIVKPIAKLFAR